jgi:hypothetical protein
MITQEEFSIILNDFPRFELCYEIMTHKKVYGTGTILAIPDGIKCFAWFTSYKEDNVCFLLDIGDNKEISNIRIILTSFDDKLALGTIFYGTSIKNKDINCFCIEDIYYYKGKNYCNYTYLDKLHCLKKILSQEISQTLLVKKFTIFGLPYMSNDFNHILKESLVLPYKVKELKFRFFEKHYSKKINTMKYYKPGSFEKDNKSIINAIFKVSAEIEPDIYNLFIYKNDVEEYYDIAFIPDYKTSVMMNKLFRNIKENINLDAIEESDNEEEFEDSREDKYVYLDRSFKINCQYNNKFKKWVPISLAGKNDRIVSFSQLPYLLTNNY